MVASRSASDRLDRGRSRQQSRFALAMGVEVVAVLGLVALVAFPSFERFDSLILACVLGGAAIAPCGLFFQRSWSDDSPEEAIAVAIAKDVAVGAQARYLAQLASQVEQDLAMTPSSCLGKLIAGVERDASNASDREARVRGDADLRARRHERIVPRQSRVVLTTADDRKLLASIVNVSRSGIAMDGNFPGCGLGQMVRIGSKKARIVRVLPRGIACEFAELLASSSLTVDITFDG